MGLGSSACRCSRVGGGTARAADFAGMHVHQVAVEQLEHALAHALLGQHAELAEQVLVDGLAVQSHGQTDQCRVVAESLEGLVGRSAARHDLGELVEVEQPAAGPTHHGVAVHCGHDQVHRTAGHATGEVVGLLDQCFEAVGSIAQQGGDQLSDLVQLQRLEDDGV